jgi:hypothetical protein
MISPEYLPFTFAPHVLEDLGVNLYTALPKALVEFVANAYDADADEVRIDFDPAKIEHAKDLLKADYHLERKRAGDGVEIPPLGERELADDVCITITDNGCGMSKEDLEKKFLVIGRRRRKGKEKTARTPKKRILMGRKGLGKLAGFGIAHRVEIISRTDDASPATKIVLDLPELLGTPAATEKNKDVQNVGNTSEEVLAENEPAAPRHIRVPVETLPDGGGLKKSGTTIVLRRLVYEGLRGDIASALKDALRENFYGILPEEFAIKLLGNTLSTDVAEFAYAYPQNDVLPVDALVSEKIPADEDCPEISFKYRIRFRGAKKQLPAKKRGVRVYAHKRLASLPDLLDVKSSAHGFQYTSYLDGVVVADFVDDLSTDYISTDRQSLRWETPLLHKLREFLTGEMNKALQHYADSVSENLGNKLKEDGFTKITIAKGQLPSHREKTAWALAKTLAGKDSGNLDSPFYKTTLQSVVNGLGHGQIISTIYEIAKEDKPELQSIIAEISKLTQQEFDDFQQIVHGRLKAIEALRKIYESVDFRAAKNEKPLHELFKKNPWMVDPTYFEFLASDTPETEVAKRLSKELEIDDQVAKGAPGLSTDERPDLTFVVGSVALRRFVIIEFKAPNIPLQNKHLVQLKGYMARANKWLKHTYSSKGDFRIEGVLIGTKDFSNRISDEFVVLEAEIANKMSGADWQVFDIAEVLDRAEAAHKELLRVYQQAATAIAA